MFNSRRASTLSDLLPANQFTGKIHWNASCQRPAPSSSALARCATLVVVRAVVQQ
jgi:hypothetical protein